MYNIVVTFGNKRSRKMPSPKKNESKKNYISRCMSSQKTNKDFPDQKQRTAFCYSQWEKSSSSKSRMEELLQSIKQTLGKNG